MPDRNKPQVERLQDHSPSITSVQVKIVDKGTDGLVGWASCVVARSIRVANIAIRRGHDGRLFLTYPAKRTACGDKYNYFNPISAHAAQTLEDAILTRLTELAKISIAPNAKDTQAP